MSIKEQSKSYIALLKHGDTLKGVTYQYLTTKHGDPKPLTRSNFAKYPPYEYFKESSAEIHGQGYIFSNNLHGHTAQALGLQSDFSYLFLEGVKTHAD